MKIEGKKVKDISELLDVFRAQEGAIYSLSGGIGQGKTYEATRMAVDFLQRGCVVYTNWPLDFRHFNFDQRLSLPHLIWNLFMFKKRFYVVNPERNWHLFDMDAEDVVDKLASLTDCVVMLDEGQDIFDSYEGTKISKEKRKTLTRTRHLNKTLYIISQRANAIAVTARANVNIFERCEKSWFFFNNVFRVRATEDIDSGNMPIWENAPVVRWHFGRGNIYKAYNSWYLRGAIPPSQQVYFDAYDLNIFQKIFAILYLSWGAAASMFHKKHAKQGGAP